MHTLRSPEAQEVYNEFLKSYDRARCALCSKPPLQSFSHWKTVVNDFPYDRIAARHDMLVPMRHITESDLTVDEWKELQRLKETILDADYDYILEATRKGKSLPDHFHLHLVKAK